MATKQPSLVDAEDDCIDMELRSSPNIFSHSIDTPQENREFEFQNKKESTTSPADELFYKGKLLPLHLPPRLEMVEKLLENPDATFGYARSQSSLEDSKFRYSTTDLRLHSTNATFPLESCNISPSESRRVSSCEAVPPDYIYDWSSEIEGLVCDHNLPTKKQWYKNQKQTKQFWLAERLKASKAYLKSLFSKSGCSDKSRASDATSKVGTVQKPKCKDDATKHKKNSFEFFRDNKDQRRRSCAVKSSDVVVDGFFNSTRRSFSGVIQRHYASKASPLSSSSSRSSSSSSSFSLSSAGSYELQLFNRRISKELENSIEGAIAYCKKSQQQNGSNNKVCSQSAVCGKKDIMGSTLLNQQKESEIVEKSLVKKNESLI